jgi:hypothetical protein
MYSIMSMAGIMACMAPSMASNEYHFHSRALSSMASHSGALNLQRREIISHSITLEALLGCFSQLQKTCHRAAVIHSVRVEITNKS